MGSTDGKEEEKPVHEVTVSTFDMSKTEVTVAQYAACVKAGACTKAGFTEEKYCNWGKSGRLNHPINCVNWDQATDFAKWAGARLPSEAEWEYAARSGGHSQTYPWGNKVPSCRLAVMKRKGKDGCGKERTWPVCSHPAGNSAQGLCDLAGNVWEWVQDEYAGYGETPEEGPGYFDEDPAYVLRGGGWCCLAQCLRASGRTGFVSSYRNSNLGFRLARSVL